ncbi:hypothetical protein FGO68_gene13319 [Halteria grandinella]|uniref:BLOC-1-related complex subunit 5 n=1 Tax=Halteria grandinella TaxID=5974 RepID=A0A8J8P5T3_HALGN|nr:hypothetical protein FGO68_gene13319 [Halteria grandinella]
MLKKRDKITPMPKKIDTDTDANDVNLDDEMELTINAPPRDKRETRFPIKQKPNLLGLIQKAKDIGNMVPLPPIDGGVVEVIDDQEERVLIEKPVPKSQKKKSLAVGKKRTYSESQAKLSSTDSTLPELSLVQISESILRDCSFISDLEPKLHEQLAQLTKQSEQAVRSTMGNIQSSISLCLENRGQNALLSAEAIKEKSIAAQKGLKDLSVQIGKVKGSLEEIQKIMRVLGIIKSQVNTQELTPTKNMQSRKIPSETDIMDQSMGQKFAEVDLDEIDKTLSEVEYDSENNYEEEPQAQQQFPPQTTPPTFTRQNGICTNTPPQKNLPVIEEIIDDDDEKDDQQEFGDISFN